MSLWFIGVGLAGMAFGGFHLIVTGMKLAPATFAACTGCVFTGAAVVAQNLVLPLPY